MSTWSTVASTSADRLATEAFKESLALAHAKISGNSCVVNVTVTGDDRGGGSVTISGDVRKSFKCSVFQTCSDPNKPHTKRCAAIG